MQIPAVNHAPLGAAHQTAAHPARIATAQVSAAVLKQANGDGDGRTGVAALNDGDAVAQAAARQVDVKA